jgi:hypothetical protein
MSDGLKILIGAACVAVIGFVGWHALTGVSAWRKDREAKAIMADIIRREDCAEARKARRDYETRGYPDETFETGLTVARARPLAFARAKACDDDKIP